MQESIELIVSRNRKLNRLIEATKYIMSEFDLDELLQILVAQTSEVIDAERCTLFLVDSQKNEIYSKVLQGEEIQEIRFPADRGIAGYVVQTGAPVNIEDAYQDERFNRDIDQETGFHTQSILTVPIKNMDGTVIGVVQVLNKKSKSRFDNEDVHLLEAFSSLMAISIENSFNFESVRRTMKAFQLFVPPKYLDRIGRAGVEKIHLGEAETCDASILFLDIRSFTSLAEGLGPTAITSFLNSYFEKINDIIQIHNGAIDKFIGDGFMATFDQNHADNALAAALGIKQHLIEFNRSRVSAGLAPIRIGIGISSGPVVIGTIGSHDRMDSTCIGNPVVVAKRIESMTKIYQIQILISHSTFYAIQDASRFHIREVDSIRVKGRTASEVIYEVFDHDDEDLIHKKVDSYPHLLNGMVLYKAREWDKAIQSLTKGLDVYPDDQVASRYVERCIFFKRNPPAESWDGVVSSEQENFMVYRIN